jgi:methionine-rich copper-binding protein CopC
MYNSTYILTLSKGAIKDLQGNELKDQINFSFTTERLNDFPKLISITPNNGTMDVLTGESIIAIFNENIIEGRYFKEIKLVDENNNQVETVLATRENKLYIYPFTYLKPNTKYTATIPAGAVGAWTGYEIRYNVNAYSVSFTTGGDKKYPYKIHVSPEHNSKNVAVDGEINIAFSEKIKEGENFSKITLKEGASEKKVDIMLSIEGNILKVRLKDNLNFAYNTLYTLDVPDRAVKDVSDNDLLESYSFNFTTSSQNVYFGVKSSIPQAESKNISVSSSITITFNDVIKEGFKFDNILIKDDKGKAVNANVKVDNYSLIITPQSNLLNSTKYTVEVPSGAVEDMSGNISKEDFALTFITENEKNPPEVTSTIPAKGGKGVPINNEIKIKFNESIQKGKAFNYISLKDKSGRTIPVTLTVAGDSITIKPSGQLSYNTLYTVEIPQYAVKDLIGNIKSSSYSFSFTTETEKVPPKVKSITPANGSVNINVSTSISVTFDKNIVKGDKFNGITIRDGANRAVSASVSLSGSTLTIKPRRSLAYNTIYTVIVPPGGVKDTFGNSQIDSYTFRFMTENPLGIKSSSISADNKIITITFNQNVIKATNFRNISLKDSKGNTVRTTTKLMNNVLTIIPKETLLPSTKYTVVIPLGSVKDLRFVPNKIEYKVGIATKRQ